MLTLHHPHDSCASIPAMTIKGHQKNRKGLLQRGLTDEVVAQWQDQMPSVDPITLSLGAIVTRISILNDKILARLCKEYGISTGALKLILALRRIGPPYVRRPTDLYQLLAVTSGAVTYTINLLGKEGLVEMIDDPQDGRSRLVQLTPKGLQLVNDVTVRNVELLQRAWADLEPRDKRDTVQRLLELARCWERIADRL